MNDWREHENYWEHIHPQGSAEWLAARSDGLRLTASNFSAALGVSPYESMEGLASSLIVKNNLTFSACEIEEARAKCPDYKAIWIEPKKFTEIAISHMRRGTMCEPIARNIYELECNVKVIEQGLAIFKKDMRLGASPDGIVSSEGMIEIKCPAHIQWKWFNISAKPDPIDRLPRTHIDQMQGNMAILGCTWCDYIVFHEGQIRTERINFDQMYWETILYPGLVFFLDCVLPLTYETSPRHRS